ncbi:MAG: arginine--tRNA ligase, partial [Alphaproteobacteria bacterium]|nr:arginine--tRNA ligase [Alphaproteobacteria bacterium]
MTIFNEIRRIIAEAVGSVFEQLDAGAFVVELPKEKGHGDISSNIAMVLSKQAKLAPREIALQLKPLLEKHDFISSIDIAGPGFINFNFKDSVWQKEVLEILRQGLSYGDSDMGKGRKINVEFVSANPTGPMHVGHGRGAVVGDALASLLVKAGYDVCREYYINDAGAQVDVLARSAYHRYLEKCGKDVGDVPEGLYPGEYLIPVAEKIFKEYGDKWVGMEESSWLEFFKGRTIKEMLKMIKEDLSVLGVRHD